LIYRTMLFGHRNGFGMHRKVTGMPEGVPEAPGEYWALVGQVEGNTPAHMGWCAPLRQLHPIRWKGEAPWGSFPFPSPKCIIWKGGCTL
jgi:hypothetical protein